MSINKPKRFGSTKYASQKHENRIAKAFGTKPVRGSGAGVREGDVQTEYIFAECKTTTKNSYSLNLSTLEKLIKQAEKERKKPVLIIEFSAADNIEKDWIVLPLDDYLEREERD